MTRRRLSDRIAREGLLALGTGGRMGATGSYHALEGPYGSQSAKVATDTAPHASESPTSVLGPISERRFMRQVVCFAKLMGWRVYHTLDSRGSAAGFPDLVLVRRPRVVWAELKSARGRVTDAQLAWIRDLQACDAEVWLWRPSDWETIEKVLRG